MSRRLVALLVVALVLYVGSYLLFRQSHIEVWQHDHLPYVIFPAGYGTTLYYLWRPLAYLDGKVTGIGSHIGPHRE
jgi:hypothetical protein